MFLFIYPNDALPNRSENLWNKNIRTIAESGIESVKLEQFSIKTSPTQELDFFISHHCIYYKRKSWLYLKDLHSSESSNTTTIRILHEEV